MGPAAPRYKSDSPGKLTLQGKNSLHNFTMQICLTSNPLQITLLKVCCHGEKLDFQTLQTSSIHKYLVNLQNFNSWLDQVLTTKQDQKLHEQDWTPGAAPYSSPPHSIKGTTLVEDHLLCNCLLCHQARFLHPVLPPRPLSGSLLQPAQVTRPPPHHPCA